VLQRDTRGSLGHCPSPRPDCSPWGDRFCSTSPGREAADCCGIFCFFLLTLRSLIGGSGCQGCAAQRSTTAGSLALTQERPEITLRGLPRRKKRRSNRQPLAAARARAQSRLPPMEFPEQSGLGQWPLEPQCPAAHSPAVKDRSTNSGAQRPTGGVGARRHHTTRQGMPALPGTSVPCLHAQCLLQMSTDGQDRTPSPRRRDRAGDHQVLAVPCAGASSAGGSLRGASATCELQPRLVPRRQSEAGVPRRMGANRHGGSAVPSAVELEAPV
jgi:hypothetical protein